MKMGLGDSRITPTGVIFRGMTVVCVTLTLALSQNGRGDKRIHRRGRGGFTAEITEDTEGGEEEGVGGGGFTAESAEGAEGEDGFLPAQESIMQPCDLHNQQ